MDTKYIDADKVDAEVTVVEATSGLDLTGNSTPLQPKRLISLGCKITGGLFVFVSAFHLSVFGNVLACPQLSALLGLADTGLESDALAARTGGIIITNPMVCLWEGQKHSDGICGSLPSIVAGNDRWRHTRWTYSQSRWASEGIAHRSHHCFAGNGSPGRRAEPPLARLLPLLVRSRRRHFRLYHSDLDFGDGAISDSRRRRRFRDDICWSGRHDGFLDPLWN